MVRHNFVDNAQCLIWSCGFWLEYSANNMWQNDGNDDCKTGLLWSRWLEW